MNIIITYKINQIMNDRNITYRELEKMSGVSRSMLHAINNGDRDPTVTTLCMIAVALDVRPEELYKYAWIK